MDTIILRSVGLFWVVIGAWNCYAALRNPRRPTAGTDPKSESTPASEANPVKPLRRTRSAGALGGLFWVVLGIAALNGSFTIEMAAFIVPCLGLFFLGIGVWSICTFFHTFRNARQTAAQTEPMSESSPPSEANPEKRLGLPQLAFRLVFLSFVPCLGIAMLWFSDFSIGGTPVAVTQSREDNNSLAEIVTQAVGIEFERQGRIGIVVGAVAENEEILVGFGKRQLGVSEPPDSDSVFEIGSITKVFTGILLAKRVESGVVNLDDRVADLLPEGWSLSESARDITLRHLTTHTSGIPRLPANLLGFTDVFKNLFGGDPYRAYTEKQFREALASVDLEFESGTDRLYSNFAVGLLGFVLATQKGSDYETLLKSELCDPLGMPRTAITNEAWHHDQFAPGYRATLKVGPAMLALGSSQWLLPNHLAGAGAIRSTGSDMLRFLKANMGLIPTPLDAAIQLSHQEIYKEDDHRAMGMNWIRAFEGDLSQNILWHNGGTGGYRSYLGFTEDLRFGVVVLTNTSHSVDGLGERILKTLVRKNTDLKPATKDGFAKVAPFTGVHWENDRPIVRVEGRWTPLVSIDGIPIERIMDFAREEFGDRARKRFAEDLVELLSKMSHEPGWEVTLGLQAEDGQVEELELTMTEENRDRVRK